MAPAALYTLYLVIWAIHAFNWGHSQADPATYSGQDILSTYLEAKSRDLLSDYLSVLNYMGSPTEGPSIKTRYVHTISPKFFHADSSFIYDDLYLYGDRKQYFNATNYLLTIPAWYPQGVKLSFAEIQFQGWRYASFVPEIWSEVRLQRILVGKDFLDHSQADTLSLSLSLTFPILLEDDHLRIGLPKILSILPTQSVPIALAPLGEISPQADDRLPVLSDTIGQIPSASKALPLQRDLLLQKAFDAVKFRHGLPPRKHPRKDWKPWH